MLRINSTATPTPSQVDSASTTSFHPLIAVNTELWIILSRTKSTSTKSKLKSLLTFGAKKPITFVKIEGILTFETEVRQFWKAYIRSDDELERFEVEICYADGKRVMKIDEETGLGTDEVAKGLRIVDQKDKFVRDVWVQKVVYQSGGRVEMV